MDKKPALLLVRRMGAAEIRLRIFLALRAGLTASFYAFCVVMIIMLLGVRVAGGEHSLISYILYWITGLFAEEGVTIEFLRAFHPPGLITMLAVGLGAAFLGGILGRMLRRIPLNQVALYLDAKTGSGEQFVTAYELAASAEASPLNAYLVEKATRRMERERLYRKPLFLPPRETWMQLIPIAVLALLMTFGSYHVQTPPEPQPPPPTPEEKDALDRVCKAMDKIIEKEKDPDRKKELEDIKKEFERLKEEKLSLEQKVAKYNELMERLRKMQRESYETARDRAAEQLEGDKSTKELGEALRKGNDAMAEEALENIEKQMESGGLSQADQEQMLENLRRAREAAGENYAMQKKLDRYLRRLSRMEKRDSLEELAKQRDLERMAKALKERNKEMYEKEIEKFLEKMKNGEMSEEDIKDMQRVLKSAAEKMGDEDVRRGLEQLGKSLGESASSEERARELDKMLRQIGYGHKDEEIKRMAREFSEKLKNGELTKEDMKRAARALEKAAEKHGDGRIAEKVKKIQEKLEGVDTEQIEKDLEELMRLMEQSEGCGGDCGGDTGRWSEEDWRNVLEAAKGLRQGALGKGWNDGAGDGFEWDEGGPGGPDSDRGWNPRPIQPGSEDPEAWGEKVDLLIKPELGKGRSAGRVYVGGKLYPRGKARRPYIKILGEMKESVLDRVEKENIPANYKKRVRDFFNTQE